MCDGRCEERNEVFKFMLVLFLFEVSCRFDRGLYLMPLHIILHRVLGVTAASWPFRDR